MLSIPRAEVESIAAVITKHACLVTDKDIISIICGGYRRGKSERQATSPAIDFPNPYHHFGGKDTLREYIDFRKFFKTYFRS